MMKKRSGQNTEAQKSKRQTQVVAATQRYIQGAQGYVDTAPPTLAQLLSFRKFKIFPWREK